MQAPTDNLYKFAAIFGLVIIVTSSILTFQSYRDYSKHNLDYDIEWKKYEKTVAQYIRQMNILHNDTIQYGEAHKISEMNQKIRKGQPLSEEESEKYFTHHEKFMKSSNYTIDSKLKEKSSELLKKEKLLEQYRSEYLWITLIGIIGFIIGICISAVGFWLWYFKLQVYLDRQISHQENLTNS